AVLELHDHGPAVVHHNLARPEPGAPHPVAWRKHGSLLSRSGRVPVAEWKSGFIVLEVDRRREEHRLKSWIFGHDLQRNVEIPVERRRGRPDVADEEAVDRPRPLPRLLPLRELLTPHLQ